MSKVTKRDRGRRTVVKRGDTEISIDQAGGRNVNIKTLPGWRSIQALDFIETPTMCRYSYCTKVDKQSTKGVYSMYRKFPSDTMLQIQCDKCSGPHRTTNNLCSANLKVKSRLFSAKPGFYNIKTGQRLPKTPRLLDEEWARAGNVSRVLLRH
jgi:hypothetical protein